MRFHRGMLELQVTRDPDMKDITRTSLDVAKSIPCPWCSFPVAVASADGIASTSHASWLFDGDAIPLPESMQNSTAVGRDDVLYVGQCPTCENHYHVIESTRVAEGQTEMDRIVQQDIESVCVGTGLFSHDAPAHGVPGQWLVLDMVADNTRMQTHMFGPFPVSDYNEVAGKHGVSPCEGRGGNAIWEGATRLVLTMDGVMTNLIREHAATPATDLYRNQS